MNIGMHAIVSPMARLGRNVTIEEFAIVHGNCTLHDNVVIRAHAVIGSAAEKHGYFLTSGMGVEVGEGTHISEHVTIHSGTFRKTKIGKNCSLLTKSHVGHDALIGNGVTISCAAMVGGESIIGDGVNLGLAAVLHQRSIIGNWAFVGANSMVPKNRRIMPGGIYVGSPARFLKNNRIGMQRMGITEKMMEDERVKYIELTKTWIHK